MTLSPQVGDTINFRHKGKSCRRIVRRVDKDFAVVDWVRLPLAVAFNTITSVIKEKK